MAFRPVSRLHADVNGMKAAKDRNSKRRLLVGVAAAGSVIAVAVLLRHPASPVAVLAPTQATAEKTFSAFLEAVRNRDWATVYALSPKQEREANGWSEQQFITFANGCAEHLPRQIGTPAIEEADPRPASEMKLGPSGRGKVSDEPLFDRRYKRVYFVSFPEYGPVRRPTGDSIPKMQVYVRRGPDGLWYVDAANPILTLSNLKDEPTETKCMRIVNALRRAGLRQVVFYDTRQALVADRLERFVRGEIDKMEIFVVLKDS